MLVLGAVASDALPVPTELTNIVTFIFVDNAKGEHVPYGTGFFVVIPIETCAPHDGMRAGQVYLVLPASVWVEVEAAAVEVDGGLEVLPVAEPAGRGPDPLDL